MSQRNVLAAVLWMAGALLSFSATAVAVRSLSAGFSVFEILSMRNGSAVLMLLGMAVLRPALRPGLRARRLPLHLVRNAVHFISTDAWAYSLTLLPLATVFAIEFTTPAWVALLAIPLLKERMTRGRLVAVLAGTVGVLIILRPGAATLQAASFLVLSVAFAFALVAIITKKLTATESTFSILFYMNLMQLPMNLAGVRSLFWQRLDTIHLLPVAGVCLCGLLSHYCLTNAYRYGDASMVVPLDFLRIPLIALVGWWLYQETLDPFVFIGSAVIVSGLVYSLRQETKTP
ncbi:DMT family transporter [Microvirga pudoricolor]|uniref:DMT family transporter n=1 Tax=Microvirga pudoricolor TaxID=2778729 RepID=UPI00194DD3E2|nr:DMT family transporter [Microvirga pudoricolor]MBM6593078.1 DMT family transporter [Microvirga pudoricolor]